MRFRGDFRGDLRGRGFGGTFVGNFAAIFVGSPHPTKVWPQSDRIVEEGLSSGLSWVKFLWDLCGEPTSQQDVASV